MKCPRCNGNMQSKAKAQIKNNKLILSEMVRCLGCGRTYAALKRMPLMETSNPIN